MAIRNYAEEHFASSGGYSQLPRSKYRFWVIFDYKNIANVFQEVSSVTLPSFNFETIQANQYNRKRNIQTRLNYDPVTVVFYDTYDNKAMNLLQRYTGTFYNKGYGINAGRSVETNSSSVVTDNFNTTRGFSPYDSGNIIKNYKNDFTQQTNEQRYFFSSIRIIQDGEQGTNSNDASTYREIICSNPMITAMQLDTLDYSDSLSAQISVTFQPEYVDIITRQGGPNNEQNAGFDVTSYNSSSSVRTENR